LDSVCPINQPVRTTASIWIHGRIERISARTVDNIELRNKVRERRRSQLFATHHVNGLRIGSYVVHSDRTHDSRKTVRRAGDVVVAALVGAINVIGDDAEWV
jgi:hypothetical protein